MLKSTMAISPAATPFAPLLFAGEWKRGLDTAIELGYDAIEASLRDPQAPAVQELVKAVHDRGFRVSAIATGQSFVNDGLSLVSADQGAQVSLRDRMSRFIDIASQWGAMVIIGGVRGTFVGDSQTYPAQRARAAEAVRSLAEYARAAGVRLAVEPINRYETKFINTVQEALGFIRDVGAENLVVLADTFHMNIEESSMVQALQTAGGKLGYLHLSDSNRRAAGQGHINFAELAAALKHMGYDGYIGAEILPIPDSRSAAQLAIDYYKSLLR